MLKLTIKTLNDDDDDNLLLWYGWRAKGVYPYFQPRPLRETLIITNLWHLINFWTDWPHLVVSVNKFWAGSEQLHCWVHIVLCGTNTPKKQHFTFPTMSPRKIKMFHYHRQKPQKSPTLSKELPSVSTGMWEAKIGAGFTFLLNSP